MDIEEVLVNHVEQGADVTIATIPVIADDATSFGIMKVNAENKIVSFIEKPKREMLSNGLLK